MLSCQPSSSARGSLIAAALALALTGSAISCAPAAVGAVAVGGTSFVGGILTLEDCTKQNDPDDGPTGGLCGVGNGVAVLLMLLGGGLMAAGGIYLAR